MKYTFDKPYYNVASLANTLAVEDAQNVYFEVMPQGGYAIRRRPGLRLLSSTLAGQQGKGVYWSDRSQKLYGVVGNSVFQQPNEITFPQIIGAVDSTTFPAVFAEGQKLDLSDIIYIANGGILKYIDVATQTVLQPPNSSTGVAPPQSTFISMMNNRFYANDLQVGHEQDFLITDVNPAGANPNEMDVLYWYSAVNPFRAAQKPDVIRGLYTGWNEAYIWGSMANEVWQEDGVTPVSPLMGSLMEIGLEAPYSVQMADNTMIALCVVQGKRAVVTIQGRAPKVISEPIANILQTYGKVSDAIGSMCYTGGVNLYLLSFPTQGVTWCYDIKTGVWTQWSSWNSTTAKNDVFAGAFGAYAKAWNKHIMLGYDGDVYETSRDFYSDSENLIHSSIRTGWIDSGTWDRKRLDQLIIKMQGYAPRDASVILRMRHDGFPEWSNPIMIDVKAGTGQNDHFCKLNRMGMHRSIQFEFIMTDAADLALVGLELDFVKMRL